MLYDMKPLLLSDLRGQIRHMRCIRRGPLSKWCLRRGQMHMWCGFVCMCAPLAHILWLKNLPAYKNTLYIYIYIHKSLVVNIYWQGKRKLFIMVYARKRILCSFKRHLPRKEAVQRPLTGAKLSPHRHRNLSSSRSLTQLVCCNELQSAWLLHSRPLAAYKRK